ncbi:peroxidase 27-like [Iris pallida]|uniref:Peroxidase n=1 Tax=Iris pallida TaxID=29817 RepID=A0AAX6ESR0_IRIPA|nr:peroxidase 27-like [Iris pallida]
MASRGLLVELLLPSAALLVVLLLSAGLTDAQGLKADFYKNTCPGAEKIVLEEITKALSVAPTLRGPLVRLHFHDCFVNGCDGSVLLNGTKSSPAEKDALPNLSLRGFAVIDRVKAKLEKACPGVVSCADILAVAARDAVALSKGPSYPVLTGRRDSRRSVSNDTNGSLPPPFLSITQLHTLFASKGLSAKDHVVLSGAHTLGTANCAAFSPRIFNFTGRGDADPALDKNYVAKLKTKCKGISDQTTLAEMDPGSFLTFDSSYYKLVLKRRTLFGTDDALLRDATAKALVQRFADNQSEFFKEFGVSMVNMGNFQVLTGTQGEIRKHCALVN